ncbi:Hydantoinase/oxoprolinase [Aquisphaera giovannonii]|uniref:Hydantoinase/oxoprolinase n=1 Tax=Aquisphaera giovannonii TaxID=406548 RepID=A0A5B9WBD2_9BACT|nr:hydantoinase/oxoprolinase family protein [Aquisphaera giovannonii]QEH37345.1 Hydantoinase/oxoprolinase [Aquisphaera giovannonii]
MQKDPDPSTTAWLALDVGGANLKAAHQSGDVATSPFEVWKRPEGLAAALAELAGSLPEYGRVALTMTAELCDCFRTKADGVRAVLEAVESAAGGRPVWTWGTDGRFHDVASIRREPAAAAASNWLALASVAAGIAGNRPGILIDVGSTTTDLIPLDRGAVAARGRSDPERLRTGELVYAGVRRTPVCALATELSPRGGEPIGLAAELFATTLDVFLTTGDIPEDPGDLATADGRPATIDAARDRLARMIGDDREGVAPADALALARAAEACLLDRLARAARRLCAATIGEPDVILVSGSGEFLARRVADAAFGHGPARIGLSESWGPAGSTAACACALLRLAAARDASAVTAGGGRRD